MTADRRAALVEKVARETCDAVNGAGAYDETMDIHQDAVWRPIATAAIDLIRADLQKLNERNAEYIGTIDRLRRRVAETDVEIERLRAALEWINQQRYTRRNTINPENAFEHAISLNEKLIAVMDAARAALAQEKPNE